jgi:putative Mn2+ efflux pump MntP
VSLLTILITAIGVGADAFAVSVGKALQLRRLAIVPALQLAITFAVFQAAMPVLGWALGAAFADQVVAVDHWIAFALLSAIGAKMIWDGRTPESADHEVSASPRVGLRELLVLGIATSIDALAVGISLAFLDVDIVLAAVAFGVATFVMSMAGFWLGHHASSRLSQYAEILGGLLLIGIGVRILIEHLTA